MTDSERITDEPKPYKFGDTVWTGSRILADREQTVRQVGVIRLLLKAGGVVTKLIDNDYAAKLPMTYDFDGTAVSFLPHWGYYSIGSLNLDVPADTDMLQADLVAARYVASRSSES